MTSQSRGVKGLQDRQQFQTTLIPDTQISDPFSSRNFGYKTSPLLPKLPGAENEPDVKKSGDDSEINVE